MECSARLGVKPLKKHTLFLTLAPFEPKANKKRRPAVPALLLSVINGGSLTGSQAKNTGHLRGDIFRHVPRIGGGPRKLPELLS